ncbi:(S)-3,5-dihydroxyphenylglycine transaminase [Terracoccus luteus]|uniref:(S)-3,5-dihydroxyphenylglycine transaminase n=1 Tax=Terracoccus luteus TaxID=53356 RepID=A0A495Y391_9MICO|nr:PLP-dependent aminotransferase family protein [Terracoccus luteus]RKT79523.1 (S)-3,5-dihydroxyphenylglycine transaminase [Terracoccus luteus]
MTDPAAGASSPRPQALSIDDLADFAASDAAEGITFLNEVAARFPDAISFAAGRPHDGFMSLDDIGRDLQTYRSWLQDRGVRDDEARARVLQYGPATGIVNDVIVEHLAKDEGIAVRPDAVLLTNGAAEALWLTLATVLRPERDDLLVVAPNYPGVWGAAESLGLVTRPAPADEDLGRSLESAAQLSFQAGRRPRAVYLSSDSGNPTGVSLTERQRSEVLGVARDLDLVVIEDNPYSLVAGPADRRPSLKELDPDGAVVRLGSFSKTIFPGLRVGYAVADRLVQRSDGTTETLATTMSRLKAMVSVNTSPVAQACVAGRLISNGLSLRHANSAVAQTYRRNRTAMVEALRRRLSDIDGVSWTTPDSGFFLQLDTTFDLGDDELLRSAEEFGVLWTPLRHFYGAHPAPAGMRLSYSFTDPDEIDRGVERLARFLTETSTNTKESHVG